MRVVLVVVVVLLLLVVPRENKVKPNCQLSYQLELVGVVSWTWVGLGFDNRKFGWVSPSEANNIKES